MASDIFSTEEINIAQAALGDSIKVSTLDGEIDGELGGVICRMDSIAGLDNITIGDPITIYGQI